MSLLILLTEILQWTSGSPIPTPQPLNLPLNLFLRLRGLFFCFFNKITGVTLWFYIYLYIFLETPQPPQPI
jgi:hypothetical protein